MDEAIEKMKRKLKRDLQPEMVDLKNTRKGGVVKMQDTDSCISISDNDTLVVRLSPKSKKTSYLVMGFLLQIIHSESHAKIMEMLNEYEKACDEDEAEDDEEPEPSRLPTMLEKESPTLQLKEAIEGLTEGHDPESIVQVMKLEEGEVFDETMFDVLPDFPDIRNVKVIIDR